VIVVDTGPLVAAANRRDEAHRLAAALLTSAGRDAVVPDPIVVEVDWLLRDRVGHDTARAFLAAMRDGDHQRIGLTASIFKRALEIDAQFAGLGLGLADASVMAVAEAENAAILTFDFSHFWATTAARRRPWRLVIDEAEYRTWRRRA
jgi:predicted nucleic acid-binding protein